MNANLQRKQDIVDEVKSKFEAASFAVLAEYRGVDVANMTDLRRKARSANVEVKIVKNTLTRRAIENTEFECLGDSLQGPLAIALSQDPVAAAKLVTDFSKDNEEFKFHTGALNGKLLDGQQFKQIADLPGREQLLSILVGTAVAPIANLLSVMNQLPASLVRVLAAVRDQKSE